MIIFSANIAVNIFFGFYELLGPTILKIKRFFYRRNKKRVVRSSNKQKEVDVNVEPNVEKPEVRVKILEMG